MADTKISGMTPGAALTGTELGEMVQAAGTFSWLFSQMVTLVQVSAQFALLRVVTAAGAITVTDVDYAVLINKTVGAASAVALPAGVLGQKFLIKDAKGDANTNNITITPAAGTIDGAGTLVMATAYQHVQLLYNGTEWSTV